MKIEKHKKRKKYANLHENASNNLKLKKIFFIRFFCDFNAFGHSASNSIVQDPIMQYIN